MTPSSIDANFEGFHHRTSLAPSLATFMLVFLAAMLVVQIVTWIASGPPQPVRQLGIALNLALIATTVWIRTANRPDPARKVRLAVQA